MSSTSKPTSTSSKSSLSSSSSVVAAAAAAAAEKIPSYVVPLISRTDLVKATEFLSVPARVIYVITDLRRVSTIYGSRWIATFDKSDMEVFMPRRFAKDAKNKTLRKKLVFIVRDPQNGLYADKPYARYMFVIPKRNCCICHIAILFTGDGEEIDQRKKLENGHCVCEETCRTTDSLCTCFEIDYVLSKVNNFEVFRNMLCVKKEEEEEEETDSEEESEEESDNDKPQKKKKSKKN